MGNDVRVSACCGAPTKLAQRLNGQMFDQCTACRRSCQTVEPSAVERNQGALTPQGDEAGVVAISPIASVQGDFGASPDQDIGCRDCSEPAEFVTFSDPPLAKCFRCALLKAMERLCALCGRHPTECIVRAISENERQDVIGICANCFSKRLSGMRN